MIINMYSSCTGMLVTMLAYDKYVIYYNHILWFVLLLNDIVKHNI